MKIPCVLERHDRVYRDIHPQCEERSRHIEVRILRGYEEDELLSIVPLDPVLDRERLACVRQEPDGLRMGVQDCADRLSHFCRIRRYERVSHSALQALEIGGASCRESVCQYG